MRNPKNKTELPPISFEKHPWKAKTEYASRTALRKHSGPYQSAVTPQIAALEPTALVDAVTLTDADEATQQLIRFDEYVAAKWGSDAEELAPMNSVLLRTESASSSQIENLTVGARQLALAELGEISSRNAQLVSSNVDSMEAALDLADQVSVNAILEMHRRLLDGEDPDAGQIRNQQVWIGGSPIGPHQAAFIPPHHTRVRESLEDLVDFCRRDDIPPLTQIAVAHAQFETIHPFTDGNGRTGRALVQAMLKGSGLTQRTTVPLSAGLLVDTDRYFAALGSFREGEAAPIVGAFSQAARYAAAQGRELVDDLDEIRVESASRIKARSDAAVWRLNDLLIGQPVVNTTFVADRLGVSKVAAQTAITKLEQTGTLTESTRKVRYRAWQANDVLARLDEFATQIKRARGSLPN